MPRPAVIQFTSRGRMTCYPQAIAMSDLPAEEVTDGGKAYVRVGPHVRSAEQVPRQFHGTCMIEKDERSHHTALPERQDAANLETAPQICFPGIDYWFEHKRLTVDQIVPSEQRHERRQKSDRLANIFRRSTRTAADGCENFG